VRNEYELLFGKALRVNEDITVHNPTIGDILEFGEQRYYSAVFALTASPSAYKVQLDDMGIDYEDVSDFEFFCLMCKNLSVDDTRILLGEVDLSKFTFAHDPNIGQDILYCPDSDTKINMVAYMELADNIRMINGFEKIVENPGNKHFKKFAIERERAKQQRKKKQREKSMLLPLVSAMVNSADFKYDHASVLGLPISTFNDSLRRIQKIKEYTQYMSGVYSGNIQFKGGKLDDGVNWLS